MRRLYYVSVRHTLSESVFFEEAFLDSLNPKERVEFLQQEEKIFEDWKQIREKVRKEIKRGNIDCFQLFIYQDGWHENLRVDLLSWAAAEKNPNTALLSELISRGAKLIATENEKFVAKHKEIFIDSVILHLAIEQVKKSKDIDFQAAILKRARVKQKHLISRSAKIKRERDKYIAKRIYETLQEGGTGLLFIGKAHEVIEKLDLSKFKIINLLETQE